MTWLGNDRLVWGGHVSYWGDGGKPANRDKPAGEVLARDSGKVLWQFRGSIRNDFFTLTGALDGQRLVIMEIPDQPRGAFLLDGATGEVLKTCFDPEHGSGPLSVGISPDGRTLAAGYGPYDVIRKRFVISRAPHSRGKAGRSAGHRWPTEWQVSR